MMKALKTAVIILGISSTACNNQATTPEATREKNKDTVVVNKPDTVHNSKNSLDWAGVYEGELPCADCSGIKTTISINADGSFKKKEVYQGKKGSFDSQGVFAWDSTGSIITLSADAQKTSYKVGENKLMALDMDGKIIEGPLADKYILLKAQ
jgi:uncharacterized lipoprotein NlpE involved in copper resistance